MKTAIASNILELDEGILVNYKIGSSHHISLIPKKLLIPLRDRSHLTKFYYPDFTKGKIIDNGHKLKFGKCTYNFHYLILQIKKMEVQQLILERVSKFFDYDISKTLMWFTSKNPHLGEATPVEMIKRGRSEKLLTFINGCLNENNC